jgi:hypothetical protein
MEPYPSGILFSRIFILWHHLASAADDDLPRAICRACGGIALLRIRPHTESFARKTRLPALTVLPERTLLYLSVSVPNSTRSYIHLRTYRMIYHMADYPRTPLPHHRLVVIYVAPPSHYV